MAKQGINERMKDIISDKPSKWQEQVLLTRENRSWLDKSAQIALKILRTIRSQSISQKDLAVMIGVTPQYINKVVKGQENLSLETISKIEKVLGISLIAIPSFEASQVMSELLLRSFSKMARNLAKPLGNAKQEYNNYSDFENQYESNVA